MKGKRDNKGCLQIKRGDRYIMQNCVKGINEYCRDNCPHFGDPEFMTDSKLWMVEVCENQDLFFDEFEDER